MKAVFFPLGDIRCENVICKSNLWREMSFALHLLKQAVNPRLSLGQCLENWGNISRNLAEPPRKRKLQLNKLVS